MRTYLLTALAIAGLTFIFTSCEKDDNVIPANTIVIDASAYDKWVYFSFEEGSTVEIADYKTSMDWDLGFHRFDVRVNGGKSGPGQGGTYATGETDFNAVTAAPVTGYSMNDSISIAVDITSMPPLMETVPGDTVLTTWITMQYGEAGPEYLYSNEVFIVKTATGKFAKIQLKDYYNELGKSGHVNMKYSYQNDGSAKFD